jgi:ribosomal protein L11 methyltransferase
MKTGPLWQITVHTTAEAEDAVSDLVERVFGQPACAYLDRESGRATVSLVSSTKALFSVVNRSRLAGGLRRIASFGLEVGAGRVRVKRLRRQDWAEVWKSHFPPLEIGKRLLIKPSWSRRKAGKGQAVVVLDPGLSFGTGQHPTTAFCLGQLAAFRRPDLAQSLLDIGTGSGILAIAGAKLGYAPVRAFDSDSDAVRVAGENAARNKLPGSLRLSRRDLARLPLAGGPKYHLVCANLTADLLVRHRRRIANCLRHDGRLVLAGVLASEWPSIERVYGRLGLKAVTKRTGMEWTSGAFERR